MTAMNPHDLYRRYQQLQSYVDWSDADASRVRSVAPLLEPHFTALIDDFYAEIERQPEARKVITGGEQQIARLKGTLRSWLHELVAGQYDQAYVEGRSRVGWRHVEIGLDQVYTNVALSRLRTGLVRALRQSSQGSPGELAEVIQSLNKLLDLDLAIIEDAYQTEYTLRQQRTERLAAIGQVAGGVAHELRNPLNVIKTSVYYLTNARNPTPEKTTEHLKRIGQQVGLADGVITTLSNFAKMPLPDFRPVCIASCVRQALEANPLPDNITVATAFSSAQPPVVGDAAQLALVFGNLIRNARDAMPSGGQLTITGRHTGGHVEVDVMDNGVGITPENLSRIMDPLFSTKARGLGLGLAIARSILEKNKGTLRVASEVGRGTTFTVQLIAAE
jgi:signal transduction histidine kinase